MKRLLLTAFVLSGAALIPLAAQAQRGGMGGGARGGGFSRGVARGGGFAARPAGRVGMRGAVRPTGMRVSRTTLHSFSPRNRFFGRNRFGFNRFDRDRFRFRNRFDCFNTFGTGFGCGNPFLSGGFGFPFFDPFFDDFGAFGAEWQQPQQQPVVVENQGNEQPNRELAFEVQSLRDEIQAMHDEELARNQARNNPPSRPSAQPESASAVLVFRDGRQLAVQNYAVSDHTIWVLSPNSARKFPVSDLDVSATEQANAKNGVEFRLPH